MAPAPRHNYLSRPLIQAHQLRTIIMQLTALLTTPKRVSRGVAIGTAYKSPLVWRGSSRVGTTSMAWIASSMVRDLLADASFVSCAWRSESMF